MNLPPYQRHSETSREAAERIEPRKRQKTTKHGGSHLPEYYVWANMKYRCCNPNFKSYRFYGARGIKVCARWRNSFANFIADMGRRPPGTTIERKNSKKGYSPSNCIWASWEQQYQNKRSIRWIKYQGQTLSLTQWANKIGLHPRTLKGRLDSGYSVEDALQVRKYSKWDRKFNDGEKQRSLF